MNRPRQENPPLPDRWWLVALVSAMVAVAAAITMLYLPERWSWLVLLALVVFVFTYWLHPALWYRRRAEAAFAIAVVTTLTPGLDAFVHWGPGTLASLVIDTGWPATVFPWLAAIGFGWLDYLSRRPLAADVSPSSGAQPIHQQTTAVAGPIIAQRVDLTIHQAPVSHAEIPASPASPAQAIPRTHYDLSRILKYAPGELIGREAEIKLLNDAWTKVQNGEPGRPRILSFVALGGEGKTALVAKWAAELAAQDWPGCDAALAWSFS